MPLHFRARKFDVEEGFLKGRHNMVSEPLDTKLKVNMQDHIYEEPDASRGKHRS